MLPKFSISFLLEQPLTPVSPLGHQFVLAIREKLTILADGGHTVWDVYIEYVVVLRKESTTQKRHFLLLSILPPG